MKSNFLLLLLYKNIKYKLSYINFQYNLKFTSYINKK